MDSLLNDIDAERISPAEAFGVLGNETRLAILRALWATDEPMSFTDLRSAVDPDDEGNFSYHVGKLTDHFVRKTEAGYALRFAGERVVRAIIAGTITEDPTIEPAEIDEQCAYCGGDVEMAYESEHISVRCRDCGGVVGGEFPERAYMHYEFPPAGLVGRTREETVDAAHVLYDSKVAPMMKDVCPECAGPIDLDYRVCSDHTPDGSGICEHCDTRFESWVVFECEHCRYRRQSVVWFAALNHPAVVAFCHDHGLDERIPFRKLTDDNAEFVRKASATVLDTDPHRFRVTVPIDGERLVAVLDETLSVCSVDRESSQTD